MKKYSVFLILLAFLVVITSGNVMGSPSVSAQEDGQGNKINSLLSLQVKAKLRSMEAEAAPAAEGEAQVFQALPQQAGAAPDRQLIYIHSEEMLDSSQIAELQEMGIIVYPESWLPPVGAHPTGFILADMPLDKLDELAGKDYIATLDTAERYYEAHNDLGAQKINTDDVWSANYTGAGVTIAVLDSGLDITHPDIPTPTASKDYSAYPTLDDTIANSVTGHGTHVTGTALGRGTQSGGVYKGAAPGADLVFLKIGNDSTGGASSAAMVYAIRAAVDTYNADIITMGYGGWGQYHDGSSEAAQAVDYAVSQGAAVFLSTGNEADDDEHYSGTVSANSSTGFIQVNMSIPYDNTTGFAYFLVWYDGTGTHNDLELEYYNQSQVLVTTNNELQSESSRGTESEASYFANFMPAGSYAVYLKVKNNSLSSQSFHLYYYPGFNQSGAGTVTFNSPDPEYTIGSPSDADSAIAVGAYTTREVWYDYDNDGWQYTSETVDQISAFSNRGPRVDTGAPNMPSIVTPGCGIISCRDDDVYTWPGIYDDKVIDNDGPNENSAVKNDGFGPADYYLMQGTSMACPMAAGVAALLLEKNPSLTPAQVKQAFESTATDKGAAGFDTTYGYGLLDALAALDYFSLPTMETIAEAGGQYYNTAPVLSNFGFDDETALDDGWYQMDSYSGGWTTLFTDDADTAWDSDNWTVPGFAGLSEGSHTIYFKASDDNGNVEGESGEWSWQFYKDTAAPTDPTSVNSTSHTTSIWSSDNTVDITWTDATDSGSGLDGYSILWDTSANTTPDSTKDIEDGVQTATSSALADGSSHYCHIRSVDNLGNWQSTAHLGPFYIETVPPTDPTSVNSTSHTTSTWSSDNTVDITWTDATDATSGLDGYSVLWDTSANTTPNSTKDIEDGVQTATSSALADGSSHYCHIRSVDNAGNWQSTVHLGPFYIDTTPPSDPTSVNSTSHSLSTWSSDNTVDITWTDATDSGSGLDGYSILWNTSANTTPSANKTIEEGVGSTTSSALADGSSHYCHIRSVDNLGNWQSTAHLGPFYIAVNAPFLSSGNVSPTSGYTSANFTFSVNYTDFENDAPVSITITTDNTTTANMTEQDSLDVDFTDGKIYEYSVLGSSLGLGSHTFQFAASDGIDNAVGDTSLNSGPTVSSPPSPPSNGGGGGGGGGGGMGGVTSVLNVTSNEGRFLEDVTAQSGDKNVEIYIPKDTIGKNKAGSLISSISIAIDDDRPPPPSDTKVIGKVYKIKPDGAVFDPPITLTFKYDVVQLPEGVAETVLVVHKWNLAEEQWVRLESIVDPENHTVSAEIGGFSIYAAMAHTLPASFILSDLTINPESIDLGSDTSISVILTNTGDLTGNYEVSLKVDDLLVQTKEVTLDGGDTEIVSFSMTPEVAGERMINVGGLTGKCKVEKPKAPVAFSMSNLIISPAELDIGESVIISVTIANTGDLSGTHEVSLKIDGVQIETRSVTLSGGESQEIAFTTSEGTAGTYSVNIDGLFGSFVVKEEAPVPAEEEKIIMPSPAVTPTLEPSPAPESVPSPQINWWTIVGIIIGIVIAGLASFFFIRKRKKSITYNKTN